MSYFIHRIDTSLSLSMTISGTVFLPLQQNLTAMKNTRKEDQNLGKRTDVNKPRPENKDELDSRENKEQGYRGNDNKPEKKEKKNTPK